MTHAALSVEIAKVRRTVETIAISVALGRIAGSESWLSFLGRGTGATRNGPEPR
jgi:hypothetical protein